MSRLERLDYGPLAGSAGIAARLRAVGRSNLMVIGATIGVLMVLVTGAALVGMALTGNLTADIGALVCLLMVFFGGIYVLFDVSHKTRGGTLLEGFARANGGELLGSRMSDHYAGRSFADGSYAVQQAVRLGDEAEPGMVEIGDRFPMGVPRRHQSPNEPELYLRARLAGPVPPPMRTAAGLASPELQDRLTELAGPHRIEVTGDELTVFGTRPLEPGTSGRVQCAIELADDLAARANAVLVRGAVPTTSGVPVPVVGRGARNTRTIGPWGAVGLVLALMTLFPLGLAVVMSNLDDHIQGEGEARVVVSIVVLVAMVLVAGMVRLALAPRRGPSRRKQVEGNR